MTRMMRKYKTWLMVGFGILLMLAFLGGPMIQELQGMQRDRVVAKIDGRPVRMIDMQTASREISAFAELGRRVPFFDVGIPDGDVTHWLLLTREAEAAGLVGEETNGQEYLDILVPQITDNYIQQAMQTGSDPALMQQIMQIYMEQDPQKRQQMDQKLREDITNQIKTMVVTALGESGLNSKEIGEAIARFAGVQQLRFSYAAAPRVSSRAAVVHAKQQLDAVTGDYIFIPATSIAGEIPDPTPEQLQAHFERFREVKPGEGEYGIGYLLPQRIKLEYLKLDRAGIEGAIELDPIQVRKIYTQNRTQYPGEFATEQPRIEQQLRAERAEQILREAHAALQRQVQKTTRRLDAKQRYLVLPANWEEQRPRMSDLANAVVEEVRTATGVTIPTPEVTTLADSWFTQQELAMLPGIGRSLMQQGSLRAAFPQVAFWVPEFNGTGFLPVQTGVPIVDNYVEDAEGNRYFFTVLATRPESAPESVAELGQEAIDDYKRIVAYEQATGQLEQVERAAEAEGLQQVAQNFNLQPPAAPEGTPAPTSAVKEDVVVRRVGVQVAEPALQEEEVRAAIVDAAAALDPLTPPEQWPADAATIVTPAPKQLGVLVFRAQRVEPLTQEMVRIQQLDNQIAQDLIREEMARAEAEPFSLEALLKRHMYVVGDRRVSTLEELRRGDQEG